MSEFTIKNGVYTSTKVITLGSCAFRQWKAAENRPGAGANSARCSKVHGYNLTAKFHFQASSLDERNWVVDFGALKGLKTILENQFDHTLCVAENDPCLELFKQLHSAGACDLRIMPSVGIERTAEFCFHAANKFVAEQTNNRAWCTKVEVWEHENNSATYGEEITTSHSFSTNLSTPTVLLNETLNINHSDSSSVINTPVTIEPQKPVEQSAPQVDPRSAKVGNVVSTGFSDLFKGTSWGKK